MRCREGNRAQPRGSLSRQRGRALSSRISSRPISRRYEGEFQNSHDPGNARASFVRLGANEGSVWIGTFPRRVQQHDDGSYRPVRNRASHGSGRFAGSGRRRLGLRHFTADHSHSHADAGATPLGGNPGLRRIFGRDLFIEGHSREEFPVTMSSGPPR